MKKMFEILPPMMPNFVRFKKEPRPRQEGFNPKDEGFPIENFTEEEAKEFAQLMYDTFMSHWMTKKINQNPQP